MLRELAPGLLRLSFPLPLGIDHVHCYLARGEDGAWTAVDTGLSLPHVHEGWQEALASLDAPVERLVVTHFHPDHIGASAFVQELTGAEAFEGRHDRAQAEAVWRAGQPRGTAIAHLRTHGMPEEQLVAVQRESDRVADLVQIAEPVTLIDAGDVVDGWEAVHTPGHADGHIALFRDDGVMLAGDVLLGQITPNVGLWPNARPDPLGDFVASLGEIVRRAPRIAYPGHGRVIEDPAGRAREILDHHDARLALTAAALRDGPRTAYEASLAMFADGLSPELRRFAVVETLAHLEHLAVIGGTRRLDGDTVRYAAA